MDAFGKCFGKYVADVRAIEAGKGFKFNLFKNFISQFLVACTIAL
jgi:hypothetical protein